jgi:SAM-dependent methyltransferase
MNPGTARQRWSALVEDGRLAGTWYEARVRYGKAVRYLLNVDRERSVMDVGCGTGGCLSVVEGLGFVRLFGVEVTEAHVRRARERCRTAFYVVADGEMLPFKDGSIDCVISVGAIEHYSDTRRGMAELCRIVKRTLVITSDCYAWRVLQLFGLYRSFMPVDRAMWPPRFFRLLRAGGMEIVHYDGWGTTHYRRGFKKLARRLGLTRTDARTTAAPASGVSEPGEIAGPDRCGRIRRWLRLFVLDENVFCATRRGGRR